MKKLILTALVILISACRPGGPPPTNIEVEYDAKILAVGDSITSGYGVMPDEAWPAVLAGMGAFRIINEAQSGASTQDLLSALPDLVSRHKPDLIVATIGGNDLLRKYSRRNIEHNLMMIGKVASDTGIPLLVLAIPDINPARAMTGHQMYDLSMGDIAGVYIDRVVLPKVYSDQSLLSDPIHPNAEGHEMIAKRVHSWLFY